MTTSQSIIACIISDGGIDTMPKCIAAGLTPSMFSGDQRGAYTGCLLLHEQGKRIDELSLGKNGAPLDSLIFDPIDNPSWVIGQYIQYLIDDHRVALLAAGINRSLALTSDGKPDDAIDYISKVTAEYQSIGNEDTAEAAGSIAKRVNKELMDRLGGKPKEMYSSQYDCMTNRFGGFMRKNLYFIGGLPGTGKTALALNIAQYLSKRHDLTGIMFSMEMTAEQCVERMYCSRCKIDSKRYRDGILNGEEQVALAQNALAMNTLPFYIDERGGLSISQIEATVQARKNRGKLDYVIIDHLHIMNYDRHKQKHEGIADTCSRLKTMSKKHNIIIIPLIQLNRETEKEDRDPRQSDALGGSGIEHNADVMMLLRRIKDKIDYNDQNNITVRNCFVKNRHGEVGNDLMSFKQNILRYENYDLTN